MQQRATLSNHPGKDPRVDGALPVTLFFPCSGALHVVHGLSLRRLCICSSLLVCVSSYASICVVREASVKANHVMVNGMLRPRPRTKHQLCQPSAMLKLPNCRKPFALELLSERKRAPAIVNWNAFHWAAHLQLTTSAYSRQAAMQVCRPRCVGAASVLLHAFGASSG